MATAASLGIKAPAGGFQNGGWYSARQYWNGNFGEVNQIINPNQQGAGGQVSAEVVRAGSVAAGLPADAYQNYINAGAPVTGYKNTAEVQVALNKTQNSVFTSSNNVSGGGGSIPGVQSADEIAADLKKAGLLPTDTAPTAPSMADTYKQLADAKGVDAINASIVDLQAQADALVAQTRTNVSAEKGKPVATNVIEGRVTVQKTQAQEQLDFINRQLTVKQNQLTAALGNIKMIMDFTQTDYSNASDAYNKQFDQAITTINLVHGIQQDQKTDVQRAQDNARANAQIMVNAIKDGNMELGNLSPDAQAQLNTLEVQAGLPVGFFSSIKMDAKANIISTTTDNGVTQVLMRNPDGSISVQKYGTSTGGSGGKAGSAEFIANGKSNIVSGLNAAKNSYGHVTPATFQAAESAWIGDGLGDRTAFVANFSQYTDPKRGDFEQAYGFSLEDR